MEGALLTSRPALAQADYLKDQTTGDIVWPPDAQLQCRTLPWTYAVVAVEEKEASTRVAPLSSSGVRQPTIPAL